MNGVNPRFDFTAPLPSLQELGRTHFIAIGGSGMSGVARVLIARGVPVSGSDMADSPVLQALSAEGARTSVGHDPANVEGVDTVVISSAIREDNVELAAARAAGLRVLHRSQALAASMADSRRVAVAGANGKTTTTSMLTVALQEAGVDPSFAAGGELARHGTNAHWGGGDVFVAEADESDGSFLVYRPLVGIVTNVQPDHLDFYGTAANVADAYQRFAETIAPDGLLVACHDDPGSLALASARRAAGARVLTYGFAGDADLVLSDPTADGLTTTAVLTGPGGVCHPLSLQVPGRHNLLNAAAAYLAASEGLGVDAEAVLHGLAQFSGTRRRFEVKGKVDGVRVVDDYAHNGPKVAAVVCTAADIAAPARLHVVFQPHLYSRTRDFAEDFARGLAPAHTVVLMDIYGAREQPMEGITSEVIAAPLRALAPEAELIVAPPREQIPALLAQRAREGDVVLVVGAGDVTRLGPEIVAALRSR
ncbi:MAG: UDP-N-acetylmuramate--L-alanine ligase [Micrococcales bacterium]|nr:UDP-N-acetylmuramate--L-alanine ligase [Micrococcales bacterium]